MKRRNFLKLCCAAVVTPSVLASVPTSQVQPFDIHQFIAKRVWITRQALIDDLESYVWKAVEAMRDSQTHRTH